MSAALKTGADSRAMRNTKFPAEFSKKVDMAKVNLPVIKKWVVDETARILKTDDDVVTEMIFSILEGSKSPNIKQLQTDLMGFLDKDTPSFCLELWRLCLSAQDNNGIPKELLEAKKHELAQERLAEEQAMKQQEEERERHREVERARERERDQRHRGGRGGGREGGRGGEGRHGREPSRSPARRPLSSRDLRSSPPRRRDRAIDSYIPSGRSNPRRRRRSSSHGHSSSRSASPPLRRRRRQSTSSDGSRFSPPQRKSFARGSNRDDERNTYTTFRAYDRRRHCSPPPRSRRSPSYAGRRGSSPPRPRPRSRSRSRSLSRRRKHDDPARTLSPPRHHGMDLAPDDLMAGGAPARDDRRLSRNGSREAMDSRAKSENDESDL